MQSYRQALYKILKNSFPLKPRRLPLGECLGLALAKDIYSPEYLPAFDNSAVDGYAVFLNGGPRLKVQGEVRAGGFFKKRLKPGQAVRIFTGAPVPAGSQAVVMQEDAEISSRRQIVIRNGHPKSGENIRRRGEDVRRGDPLLKKGAPLGPAHLAALAAVGFHKAPVIPAPSVAILATGSELASGQGRLGRGKIRDSNTILLRALVQKAGGVARSLPRTADQFGKICRAIRKGLKGNLLLISGGVSVGKYDRVRDALRKEGVRQIFWEVNIKPGKPLYFGTKGRTLVFGLPGNPVSAFVTFEEFVKPAIGRLRGISAHSRQVRGKMTAGFRNGPRLHFVRVRCVPGANSYSIRPLARQGSHELAALAASNALLRVEPNRTLAKGQIVQVRPHP